MAAAAEESRAELGDRSTLARLLVERSGDAALIESLSVGAAARSAENQHSELDCRDKAVYYVFQAVNGKDRSQVFQHLENSAARLREIWWSPDAVAGPALPGKGLTVSAGANDSASLLGFCDWLNSPDTLNDAATQAVADFCLFWALAGVEAESDGPQLSAVLRRHFSDRLKVAQDFRHWYLRHDWGQVLQPAFAATGPVPICIPILLETTIEETAGTTKTEGVIRWLVVDVFRDGLGGLMPDLLTLGMTTINSSRDGSGRTFQQHFERVWQLSGLGERGYSARWRLLSRAPLHRDYLFPAVRGRDDDLLDYLSDISGNSAQAALLVALLAGSGQMLGATQGGRAGFLNLDYVITAGVQEPGNGGVADPLQLKLQEVGSLNSKLAAVDRFSQCDDNQQQSLQRLFAVLLMQSEYDREGRESESRVAKSKADEEAERRSGAGGDKRFQGVRYRPVGTIQEALDFMLESNRWREQLVALKAQEWLKQWGYPQNRHGYFLDREGNVLRDGQGSPVTDPDSSLLQERSVNTGSLEYMELMLDEALRQRIGGAQEEPEAESQTGSGADQV